MCENGRNASASTNKGRAQGKGYKNEKTRNKVEDELKFATYSGSINTNRVTYGTVKDHIFTQIKKTYKYGADVTKYLSTGSDDHMLDAPIRNCAKKTDKDQTDNDVRFEQETLDMMFREHLKEHKGRTNTYEQNKIKAYSLILGYCTKQLQNRIMEAGNYEAEIEDRLYKLLQEISSKMYDPARAKYEYASITERFKMLLNTKQQDDKDLTSYTKRFKQASDNFMAVLGNNILNEYVRKTDEYLNAPTTKEKGAVWKQAQG